MTAAPAVSPTFQVGTVVGALAVAGALAFVRFFGDVPMPPRPARPDPALVNSRAALTAATESAGAWRSFLEQDARAAGLPTPSAEQMGRALVFRSDTTSRTLAPGQAPIDVAGLRLEAQTVDDNDGPGQLLVLSITNLADHDLGYRVTATPQPGGPSCNTRTLLVHDAMVVRRQATIERSECQFSGDMKLQIDAVDTVEVDGLQSVYLSRVPPTAVGGDPLLAKAHRPHLPPGMATCNLAASQLLRSGIEDGSIAWRDLVDFYARHRCDSYRFPLGYQAFTKQGDRELPAVEP